MSESHAETRRIAKDFPLLWERAKQADEDRNKRGALITKLDQEIEAVMHEVWLARTNLTEQDALREALSNALPWIGVSEDYKGRWCPPEIKEDAHAALPTPKQQEDERER